MIRFNTGARDVARADVPELVDFLLMQPAAEARAAYVAAPLARGGTMTVTVQTYVSDDAVLAYAAGIAPQRWATPREFVVDGDGDTIIRGAE